MRPFLSFLSNLPAVFLKSLLHLGVAIVFDDLPQRIKQPESQERGGHRGEQGENVVFDQSQDDTEDGKDPGHAHGSEQGCVIEFALQLTFARVHRPAEAQLDRDGSA